MNVLRTGYSFLPWQKDDRGAATRLHPWEGPGGGGGGKEGGKKEEGGRGGGGPRGRDWRCKHILQQVLLSDRGDHTSVWDYTAPVIAAYEMPRVNAGRRHLMCTPCKCVCVSVRLCVCVSVCVCVCQCEIFAHVAIATCDRYVAAWPSLNWITSDLKQWRQWRPSHRRQLCFNFYYRPNMPITVTIHIVTSLHCTALCPKLPAFDGYGCIKHDWHAICIRHNVKFLLVLIKRFSVPTLWFCTFISFYS